LVATCSISWVTRLAKQTPGSFFVQIGANDDITVHPIQQCVAPLPLAANPDRAAGGCGDAMNSVVSVYVVLARRLAGPEVDERGQ
jgi:hypothetical protein